MSWSVKKLEECIITHPAYGANAASVDYSPNKPRYIRITDINEYGKLNEKLVSIETKEADGYILDDGDFLFARTGNTVGKTLLFKKQFGNCAYAGYLIRFKLNSEILLPEYLEQFTNSEQYWNWVKHQLKPGAQPNINAQQYLALELKCPPLSIQDKIIKILATWDQVIHAKQALLRLKLKYKSSLMADIFTLNNVLKGWNEIPLIDVADKNTKYSFTGGPFGSDLKASDYTEKGVRIIQLQNIGDGTFKDDYKIYTSIKKANELISCNIYPGEIILSKMGDPVARATFIPDTEERFVMASDGIRLKVNENSFNKVFVLEAINSSFFRKKAMSASTGSTRMRIGLTDLKKITIIAPDLMTQKKYGKVFEEINNEIQLINENIQFLKIQKKGLMQKLFTEKIKVIV